MKWELADIATGYVMGFATAIALWVAVEMFT